ncbi:metallophosphoesterase, partial [Streptomyces sp. OF3]
MARATRRLSRQSVRSALSRAGGLPARVVRRLRAAAHPRPPELELTPGPRPFVRALGMVAVTLLGAWLGLLIVGSVHKPVGPMDTTMTLRPSFTGGTKINVAPLGALELDTHHGPLRLDVDVTRLDPDRAGYLVENPERFGELQDMVASDVESGTRDLALRSFVAVVAGATALGLAVYRRPRRALLAGGMALAVLAASGATAATTWNPKAILEPRFSGLLAGAPSLVGDARRIVTDFDVYQQELARLVTNMSKLYNAASTLPTYQPDPNTTRVLHVSDIHLNPAAWLIIESLVEQYEIDVIVDTGDTMDHGTAAENPFLDPASELGAPFVWVRGNHDSRTTQKYLEDMENVHVLDDGEPLEIAGLRLAGMGDPHFTPDRRVQIEDESEQVVAGRRLAAALRTSKVLGKPVDIAVGHNPTLVEQVDGEVPLALAGHSHNRKQRVLGKGTFMMIEGSTGGGGLRAVEQDVPERVSASVLYLDDETGRLQAWDEITLGGLGTTTAEVSRHLPPDVEPGSSPSSDEPAGSPSPTGSP